MFHISSGVLRYSQGAPYRLAVEMDDDLGAYYRALMPKYLRITHGRYPTHITVVRVGVDEPKHLEHWGKYEGEKVEFLYEPTVTHGKTYYWLRVLSKRLEEIRLELGLGLERSKTVTDASHDDPPEGYIKFFHCTIGNNKSNERSTD